MKKQRSWAAPVPNPRTPEVDVDPQFVDRWSPRAFSEEPLTEQQIWSLFEAARWAPSCYNDQPWLFFFARTEEDRKRFASALNETNRRWASRAPLLIFVVARRHFRHNGRPNAWAEFDTGAAWMSLALQARKLGLHTHPMAGFDRKKAHEVLGLPEEAYTVLAAVAVGYRAEPDILPEPLRQREHPNTRRPLETVAFEGRWQPESRMETVEERS